MTLPWFFVHPIILSEISPRTGEKNSYQGGNLSLWITSHRPTVPSGSGLVTQSVEQRWSFHSGKSFSLSLCGPSSSSRVDFWWNNWVKNNHSCVRPHSNFKSLLSRCYWRTTTNDYPILDLGRAEFVLVNSISHTNISHTTACSHSGLVARLVEQR